MTDAARPRRLVVLRASTAWNATRLSDQHIAERLVPWATVLYVDPPLSRRGAHGDQRLAAALDEPRLRQLRPGLMRLTPRVPPGRNRAGLALVVDALVRRAVRTAVADIGLPVRAVVSVPDRPIFGQCGEDLRVHWVKDDYVAGAHLLGQHRRWRRRGERRMARDADVIVVASPALAERWRALGREAVLVPPGCDADHLAATDAAPVPPDARLPRPVAGFVGTLSARIDRRLLEAVAATGASLLLVGGVQHGFDRAWLRRLCARPNVQWVGAKPFARLPSYYRAIDVSLVPYADTAFNRASFPLKILEGLAAGRAVVTTDLPAVRWLGTDLVTVAGDRSGFVAAVTAELAAGRTAARATRRRAFAREHTWDRRARTFAAALGLEADVASPAP